MSCRDHHNWVMMSPRPLSRLWTWRHLDQVESRLAKEGIWTRSRGLWLVESTSGQWVQLHPTDAVRIRKNQKITECTYASYIPCNFLGYMAVSTVAITYGCSHPRCNSYYNESEENLNKANIPHPRESTRGWLVSWVCEYGHSDDF